MEVIRNCKRNFLSRHNQEFSKFRFKFPVTWRWGKGEKGNPVFVGSSFVIGFVLVSGCCDNKLIALRSLIKVWKLVLLSARAAYIPVRCTSEAITMFWQTEEFITDEPDFDVFSSACACRYLVCRCYLHWLYLLSWRQMLRLRSTHFLESKFFVLVTVD